MQIRDCPKMSQKQSKCKEISNDINRCVGIWHEVARPQAAPGGLQFLPSYGSLCVGSQICAPSRWILISLAGDFEGTLGWSLAGSPVTSDLGPSYFKLFDPVWSRKAKPNMFEMFEIRCGCLTPIAHVRAVVAPLAASLARTSKVATRPSFDSWHFDSCGGLFGAHLSCLKILMMKQLVTTLLTLLTLLCTSARSNRSTSTVKWISALQVFAVTVSASCRSCRSCWRLLLLLLRSVWRNSAKLFCLATAVPLSAIALPCHNWTETNLTAVPALSEGFATAGLLPLPSLPSLASLASLPSQPFPWLSSPSLSACVCRHGGSTRRAWKLKPTRHEKNVLTKSIK